MRKSWFLVIIQFLAITYFLATGPWVAESWIGRLIEFSGLLVGLWAIWTMHPLRVSVFPEPRSDSKLIESGPYQWIRHPMYTAVLLVCFALAMEQGEWLDYLVFLTLMVNQWVKLKHEERLLAEKFPDYENYRQRTKALIPFVI